MKEQKINFKEKEFLKAIEDFFEARSVSSYLQFIEHWMEALLGKKLSKKWGKPSQLYDCYELISELLKRNSDLVNSVEGLNTITYNSKVNLVFIATEKQILDYFPYQLKHKELLNPASVIVKIFKEKDLSYYLKILNEWVAAGLNNYYTAENSDLITALYASIKRLISACWLIHERVVTKNSFAPPHYREPLLNYALTEPFLFIKEEAEDPFSMVEAFFEFTNLSGYREELQKWYTAAVTEELAAEQSANLFFIHNQYISLIQAGFLITSKDLFYTPKNNKSNNRTMGQWLLSVRDHQANNGNLALSDEAPHVLSMAERAKPLAYCKEALALSKVTKLRFGLSEWFEASISKNSSIHGLDSEYAFEQYLTLQKLTEAFYLVITENAKTQLSPITDPNYEA